MRYKACALFDAGQSCGAEANMAKLLAADASWEAANVCLQFHGGFGFAAEYDVERKFRETRLYQVRSEEHTSELQSRGHLVCRLLLEKKKKHNTRHTIYAA